MSFNINIEKNIPLRIKIADQLRYLIKNEYPDGGQIPSEEELSTSLGISRGTLRQALGILDEEGFIVRKHGSGTFINPHVLRLSVRADLPFRLTDLIENAGYQSSVKLLDINSQPLSRDISNILQITDEMEQMVLTRLFLADSKPAIYIRDHFSSSLICAEYSEDDLNNFLFDFLGKSCNIKLSYSLSEIVPTIADTEISKQLNVAESAPLMKCKDTHFNKNNMPIVFSEVYYKDEFIRFHLMRKYS